MKTTIMRNENDEDYGIEIICETQDEFDQAWEEEHHAQAIGEKRDVWNQVKITLEETTV